MNDLLAKTRKLLVATRELIFPTLTVRDPNSAQGHQRAQALWHEAFAPLNAMIEDADVLELGCDDGHLLDVLLHDGPERARSAVGIDRIGAWLRPDGVIAWPEEEPSGRLELHTDMAYLQAFDLASFDLVIARDLETVFPLDELEDGLRRVYDLIRPGGEALLHVGCAPLNPGPSGYGFLTPTSWVSLTTRIGFEVSAIRRVWRPDEDAARAAALLPLASDDERMTAAMTLRLIRPWEAWELDKVWHAKRD
jgi:SAM-dependent methyltransferase